MREIRPSGSEGGGAIRSPYPYRIRDRHCGWISVSPVFSVVLSIVNHAQLVAAIAWRRECDVAAEGQQVPNPLNRYIGSWELTRYRSIGMSIRNWRPSGMRSN